MGEGFRWFWPQTSSKPPVPKPGRAKKNQATLMSDAQIAYLWAKEMLVLFSGTPFGGDLLCSNKQREQCPWVNSSFTESSMLVHNCEKSWVDTGPDPVSMALHLGELRPGASDFWICGKNSKCQFYSNRSPVAVVLGEDMLYMRSSD